MKKLALALAVSLLAGCATTPEAPTVSTLQAPAAVYQSLAAVNYQPLNIYEEGIELVTSLTDQTPVLKVDGESHVLGWKIPAYGVYRFKLSSGITRTGLSQKASAFMPEVRLLDKDFNVVKTLSAKELNYQKPVFMSPEYFYHTFVVDNRNPLLPPAEYMLVLMTEEGRNHEIMVIDEQKEFAKARGALPPLTDDIMAAASETGTITLEAMAEVSDFVTGYAPAPAYTPSVAASVPQAAVIAVDFDTIEISRAFRSEVQNLLKEGDVVAALEMREQVNILQATLQAEFASLYKTRGSGSVMDKSALESMDLEQKLPAVYKSQLAAYFKSGQTRQALGLLDQAKNLKVHVDSLF